MHFCWLVADSKLCTGRLLMFFHNNFSFILVSNKWSYFMICCFLCTLEAVERFTGNRRSHEAFKVTENKTLRIWKWEFGEITEMRVKREKGRKEMREIKWEFAHIPSSLAILYCRKWLEITIQRSSRVQ